MSQLAIDFTAARAEGDRMAGLCLDKAEDNGFDTEAAKRVILELLRANGPTSGEDLTDACKDAGHTPEDDRAFGGVFLSLSRCKPPQIVCLRSDLPRRRGHSTSGGKLWGLAQ
jgi:hypothetical protein